MLGLAFSNLSHYKLRTILVGFGVAIGIAMLITMLGLSHGTLNEVARRVTSVNAELIVLPSKSSLIFSEGAPLSDKYEPKIRDVKVDGRTVVDRIIPVFLSLVPDMAGQQQRVFGVDPSDFDAFLGDRKMVSGKVFPGAEKFKALLQRLRKENDGVYHPDQITDKDISPYLQMIIDDRLARAGKYEVGEKVDFLGREFTICGIVQAGLAGRVFVPVQTLRHIQNGGMQWSSMFFVQVDRDVVKTGRQNEQADMITISRAGDLIEKATHLRVEPLEKYDRMLFNSFESIYVYINVANGVVLCVSFLFIMVTMYTMVLERRREIGILRSLGAGGAFIMGQTVFEALIISLSGTVLGGCLAFLAKWLIETYRPLLTVDLQLKWLALAVLVGVLGGVVSALYPGYRAARLDPVECLVNE